MDTFKADLAQLDSLRLNASDTTELLLDVASKWQQISPESLETALGMFGPDFLAAYRQTQQTYVRATPQLATISNTIENVTDRAINAFGTDDDATANSLGAL